MLKVNELSIGINEQGPLTEGDFIKLGIAVSGTVDELDPEIATLVRYAGTREIDKGAWVRYRLGQVMSNGHLERG